jgi:hypothetical protein
MRIVRFRESHASPAPVIGTCHAARAGEPQRHIAGGAPKYWETGAAVGWNALADQLTMRRTANATRPFTYLSLAQYDGRALSAANAG